MKYPTTWNLDLVIKKAGDKSLLTLRKKSQAETDLFVKKWGKRKDYLSNPKILLKALVDYEKYVRFYFGNAPESYFFGLKSALDQTDPVIKAKVNLASEFENKLVNEIQFFEINLSKIPKENQLKFLKDKSLSPYRHFLEKLFRDGEHILSDPEEKILNLKSTTSYINWVQMVSEFLSREEAEVIMQDGKKRKQNFSQIVSLIDSQNKKTRDDAARNLNEIFQKNLDVAEKEINSVLTDKKINDLLRNFKNAQDARLLNDDVDEPVVDGLAEAVFVGFNLSARFYELKAKLFGVKKLAYHERNVPYGSLEASYNFDQAVDLVDKVFSDLHPKFAQIFEGFLKGGQIDVEPKKGKSGGAACWHNLISQPTYVLLNHTNKLRDITTIAHEVGHGINNELVREKQNALNFGTPVSTAEVASTFMEDFVFEKLLEGTNEELQLQLLMSKLGDEVSTVFRQMAFYMFEKELHENFRQKGYLTSAEIGSLFRKYMEAYMGKFVEQSAGSENWWVYVSHFRSYFYVYSYASGLLISKAMQKMVRKDRKSIEKVVEFLSAGKSDSPKNIFMKMRIDISDKEFWVNGVSEFERLLDKTWQLARKLGKI